MVKLSRDTDPYAEIEPQTEPEKAYTMLPESLGRALVLGVFVFVIFYLRMQLPWQCFVIPSLLYLTALLRLPSRIRCSERELEVRYWLHPIKSRVAWDDIERLRIRSGRGYKSAHIHVDRDWYVLPITFEIQGLFARKVTRLDTLIRTIVDRAQLEFVEISSFDVVKYEK